MQNDTTSLLSIRLGPTNCTRLCNYIQLGSTKHILNVFCWADLSLPVGSFTLGEYIEFCDSGCLCWNNDSKARLHSNQTPPQMSLAKPLIKSVMVPHILFSLSHGQTANPEHCPIHVFFRIIAPPCFPVWPSHPLSYEDQVDRSPGVAAET